MQRCLGLAALLAVGSGHAAYAQIASAVNPATSGQTTDDVRNGSAELQEIIVTATRREESLQQVPVAVTALSGATLAGAGVTQARDLTQVVPGFLGVRSNSLNQPVIRGVGSSGLSVGDESNVATYVDGMYQGDQVSTALEFAEVERIEVLRGPQGTVFGRNATGGLINVITPDPSFETRGSASARYGRMRRNASDYDVRAFVNGGLSSAIAANLSMLYKHNDGYVDDLVSGGVLGRSSLFSSRGKLLFNLGDNIEIIAGGEYSELDSEDSVTQPFRGNTAGASAPGAIVPGRAWRYSGNIDPTVDYEKYNLFFRVKADLGAVNLETSTSYVDSDVLQVVDSDSSNIFILQSVAQTRVKAFAQEVRLLSGPGRFNWTAGLYYFNLRGESDLRLITPAATTILQPDVGTDSYAGFAEGTLEILPRLYVTAGGRYTYEKRTFTQNVNGMILPFGEVSKNFGNFSYRGIVRYSLSDRTNIYASYSTAFKSGVFNGTGTSPLPVNPEEISAIEGGVKVDPARWLRANLALYRYRYRDMQLTARAENGSFILQNAASATIYGGEVELEAVASDDLSFRGAVAYAHARFDEFPLAQVYRPRATGGNVISAEDVSGGRIPRAPRYTMNLGVNWSHQFEIGTIGFTGNIFHSAKVTYDNAGLFAQPAYTLANAEIFIRPTDTITLGFWSTNLTNAKVFQQVTPGGTGTYVLYQRPRRVGVSARLSF